MTKWKTVKLKGDVRDKAKDLDGYTYTEIMKTGVDTLSDGDTNTNTHTQGHTTTHTTPEIDVDEVVEELKNELSMAPEPGVDEEQIVEDVTKRLDDLETELKTQIERLQ